MKIEFESVEDLYKAIQEAKDSFNEKEFIGESYHMFLQAVQQAAEKDVYKFSTEEEWIKAGSPRWNLNSTPEEWFHQMLEETKIKIKDIKKRMKYKRDLSSFQKLVAPLTEGKSGDRLELPDAKEVEETPYEFFEYMDWAAHKQMEAIKKYLNGHINISEIDLAMQEAEYEVGKAFAKRPEYVGLKPGETARKLSDLISLGDIDATQQIN